VPTQAMSGAIGRNSQEDWLHRVGALIHPINASVLSELVGGFSHLARFSGEQHRAGASLDTAAAFVGDLVQEILVAQVRIYRTFLKKTR
jgi:hypothetical protein